MVQIHVEALNGKNMTVAAYRIKVDAASVGVVIGL